MKENEDLIGKEVVGFKFKKTKHGVFYANQMDEFVGQIGKIIEYSERNRCFIVQFQCKQCYSYPAKKAKKNLVESYEKLIGKKVVGFEFEKTKLGVKFPSEMRQYIGQIGKIISYDYSVNCFRILFKDGQSFSYPVKIAKKNLVDFYEDLIGRYIKGFEFETVPFGVTYTSKMDKFIGEIGQIIKVDEIDSTICVAFDKSELSYPIWFPLEGAIKQLVSESEMQDVLEFSKTKEEPLVILTLDEIALMFAIPVETLAIKY